MSCCVASWCQTHVLSPGHGRAAAPLAAGAMDSSRRYAGSGPLLLLPLPLPAAAAAAELLAPSVLPAAAGGPRLLTCEALQCRQGRMRVVRMGWGYGGTGQHRWVLKNQLRNGTPQQSGEWEAVSCLPILCLLLSTAAGQAGKLARRLHARVIRVYAGLAISAHRNARSEGDVA